MENSEIKGPWRATRLWNDIVRNFRSGMPVKRHRKGMKTYDNCFSSHEAVEWLHKNLQTNANFGAEVTREQTVQLLKKLYRAGIIETAKDDGDDEFLEMGGLYRFSLRSPVKTPGKTSSAEKRRVLADVGNARVPRSTRRKVGEDATPENEVVKPVRNASSERRREASRNRRETEAMKKRLNLSYFQALPANSLIILDNDDTWRSVFLSQLGSALSPHHVEALIAGRCMDVAHVMHNMTKISAKGIVQLEDKTDDLPHWVLSAMKCLANWPRQLKTATGKESCLPSYPGFENDVFNVVKDYFLGLSSPLTTFPLYEYFIEAYVKAEAISATPLHNVPLYQSLQAGCHQHPHSIHHPCTRPYTLTDLDAMSATNYAMEDDKKFYTMEDVSTDEFRLLSNQERIAKIRQTFEVLPPLSSGSRTTGNNSNSTQWSCGQSTTLEGSGSQNSVLSPDMSTTAIMRTFLPPNTCFETAFMEESPITRIVPQKENEVLHLQRSASTRSFTHIPNSWEVRSIATQTSQGENTNTGDGKTEDNASLKRLPKWRRNSRLRKSIAVMESPPEKRAVFGMDNKGFSDPAVSFNPSGLTPGLKRIHLGAVRDRQPYSTSDLPPRNFRPSLRGFSSVDDLLSCRENMTEEDFMTKYRQMKGDLRHNNNAFELSRSNAKPDNTFIPSKTVRKEKRKKKSRDASSDRESHDGLSEVNCYYNFGQVSPVFKSNNPDISRQPAQAPLATPEESGLTPHQQFNRSSKYNASYRLANNHTTPQPHKRLAGLRTGEQGQVVMRRQKAGGQLPSPVDRRQMQRTSTLINLPQQEAIQAAVAATQTPPSFSKTTALEDDCLYVRAEPYLNSDMSSVEATYASMNHGIYSQTNLPEAARRQNPSGCQGRQAGLRCQQGPHSDSNYQSTRRPLLFPKPTIGSNFQSLNNYQSIRRPPAMPNSYRNLNYATCPNHSSNHVQDPSQYSRSFAYPTHMPIQDTTYAPTSFYSSVPHTSKEAVYTAVGPGPIRRYTVPPDSQQLEPNLPQARLERPEHVQSRRRSRSSDAADQGPLSRRNTIRGSRWSQVTADSGRYSSTSKAYSAGQPSPMQQSMDDELYATARSHQSNSTANTSGSLPPRGISAAVDSFRLLGLLLPPPNRRKLQLLLKFIKKVRCNDELNLGPDADSLTMNTFLDVALRPKEFSSYDPDLARKVLQFFLDHYDEIWTPPQGLRKEVEERVYQSLVNRRLQAGEDPYPVTYCEQKTIAEYEQEKLTGAQAALVDLLDAILVDAKLSPNDKKKKLKKFKTAYEDIWRRKFPTEEDEPECLLEKKEKKGKNKFSSLSRIRSVVGI